MPVPHCQLNCWWVCLPHQSMAVLARASVAVHHVRTVIAPTKGRLVCLAIGGLLHDRSKPAALYLLYFFHKMRVQFWGETGKQGPPNLGQSPASKGPDRVKTRPFFVTGLELLHPGGFRPRHMHRFCLVPHLLNTKPRHPGIHARTSARPFVLVAVRARADGICWAGQGISEETFHFFS